MHCDASAGKKRGHMNTTLDQEVSGDLIRGWRAMSVEAKKSRTQLWRDIRAEKFPAPIEIGPNSVAWFRAEVEAWKRSRRRRTYRAGVDGTEFAVHLCHDALHAEQITKNKKPHLGVDTSAKHSSE